MRAFMKLVLAMTMSAAATTAAAAVKIDILDYCDPTDPAWVPTGGCTLKDGDITFAEFNALLDSVLSPTTVVGHPAWRFEPTFAETQPDGKVRAVNLGGRGHTFTEVAAYGGGFIPGLSKGLIMAPECATAAVIPPGGEVVIANLSEGDHRFQCCIHPWMRTYIQVE